MLTVKTLIELLQAYNEDDVVIIQYPGIQFSPLSGIEEMKYCPENNWEGDAVNRNEDEFEGVDCIVLSTTR